MPRSGPAGKVWRRLSPLLFWVTVLLLLPLLVWQGRRTRRDTPRLPEASGADTGQWGEGEPVYRVLVIGESTAAGVGVDDHASGLASQLARALHQGDGQTCGWQTLGQNGARLAQVIKVVEQAPLLPADSVLVSMGVNDTTGFTSLWRYRQQLLRLQSVLALRFAAPLLLLTVPPMHRFTALPQPLRMMLGWRARQIDQVKHDLATRWPERFRHVAYPPMSDTRLLASDGYHPGHLGYQAMAVAVAPQLRGTAGQRPLNTA